MVTLVAPLQAYALKSSTTQPTQYTCHHGDEETYCTKQKGSSLVHVKDWHESAKY